MMFRLICMALMVMGLAGPSIAQDRRTLGWGQMFTNDIIGDTKDRWRSGSYALSYLRGPVWTGQLPDRFGELLELRFRGEIIAPDRVSAPAAQDRRYVGALSLGVHSHWQRDRAQFALGLDLIVVGPQTKLDAFQADLHDIFGGPKPNVANFQVDDAVYPTLTFEVARRYDLGPAAHIRPFIEAQAGAETLLRMGADLTFGDFGKTDLLLRDAPTGQRYIGVRGSRKRGLSLLVGGDLAYVADSRYLATPGIVAEDVRARFRIGYNRNWKRSSFFYGVTYLSKEFEAQSEGQILGSVSFRMQF